MCDIFNFFQQIQKLENAMEQVDSWNLLETFLKDQVEQRFVFKLYPSAKSNNRSLVIDCLFSPFIVWMLTLTSIL